MAIAVALAIVAIPIIEITLLIQVGGIIGVWRTVALIVITAVIGTALLRAQGLRTLQAAQASLNRNEMPVAELFDGACLLVAGVLLLTPGFVTDTIGLLLFIPPVRRLVRALLSRWVSTRARTTIWVDGEVVREREPPEPPRPPGGEGRTIEGDWRRLDDSGRPAEGKEEDGDDRSGGGGSKWGRE